MPREDALEDPDVRKLVGSIRLFLGDLDDEEALAIVYAKYPAVARGAIAHGDTSAKGPLIALRLVKRGKVSPELGSKIAGMELRDFLKYLSRHKVPVVEHDTRVPAD